MSEKQQPGDDAMIAVRYLAVKAAIFIAIPLLCAVAVVWWVMG